VAVTLLFVGIAFLFIDAATLMAFHDEFMRNIEQAGQATDTSTPQIQEAQGIVTGLAISSVCAVVVFSLAIAPLTIFVLRGSNGCRIALLIVMGLALLIAVCCSGGQYLPIETGDFGETYHEANLDTRPPIFLIFPMLTAAAWIAAFILLLVPASNRFFRPRTTAGGS